MKYLYSLLDGIHCVYKGIICIVCIIALVFLVLVCKELIGNYLFSL